MRVLADVEAVERILDQMVGEANWGKAKKIVPVLGGRIRDRARERGNNPATDDRSVSPERRGYKEGA